MAVASDLLSAFSTRYEQYLADPAVEQELARQKAAIFDKYGASIRPVLTKSDGSLHFLSKYGSTHIVNVSPLRPSLLNTSFRNRDPVLDARMHRILSKDGNPAMMPCVESFALGTEYIAVSPLPEAGAGDLLNYLLDPNCEQRQLKAILTNLLYAVAYLHKVMHVAHLDIKPENVALGFLDQVILREFGYAQHVESADREAAKLEMLQRLEKNLQISGVAATEIEKRKKKLLSGFNALYDKAAEMHRRVSAILTAPSQQVDALIRQLPPLTVPLSFFFRATYQEMGFRYDAIHSIEGYSDPENPTLSGTALVNSFLAHLRHKYPEELDQKRELAKYSATLKPGQSPKLYALAVEPDSVVAPAPISGLRGTLQYMCPALRAGEQVNPFAADVYSLGVVLFIVATGFQPYTKVDERAFTQLQHGGVAHLLKCYGRPEAVHPTCLALLEKMMSFDPNKRPTIDECIKEFSSVQLIPFAS